MCGVYIMKEIKNTISDAQKAAQKKYDQKTKTVSVKYTPADMDDYERLKKYLDKKGKSTNKFIKELINDFFDSGKGEIYKTVIDKRLHSTQLYSNYVNISIDNIKPLLEYFGEVITGRMLAEYNEILENAMITQRAACEIKFNKWLEDVMESIEKGDFDDKTVGARYRILKDSLYKFLEAE